MILDLGDIYIGGIVAEVNYCKLYGDLVKYAVPLIEALREGDLEVGMAVCKVDNKLYLSNRRIIGLAGTYIYRCDVGETDAFVHSHILSDKASLKDHISSIKNNVPRMCIIYKAKDGEHIRCYSYENLSPKEKEELVAEMMKIQLEIEKNGKEKLEEYKKAMEKYDKKFFLCDEKIEEE